MNTTINTESPQHNLEVGSRISVPFRDDEAEGINIRRLRLQHVEIVGRLHSKADVAFEVARSEIVAAIARPVLWEVPSRSHDELGFV